MEKNLHSKKPTSWSLLKWLCVFLLDMSIIAGVFFNVVYVFQFLPNFSLFNGLLLILLASFVWFMSELWFGSSLGFFLVTKDYLNLSWLQRWVLTQIFFSVYISFFIATEWMQHPFWSVKPPIQLSSFSPPSETYWQVIPWFFTMGFWPLEFNGHAVIPRLTYVKRKEREFIRELGMIWDAVDAKVFVEAPITPRPLVSLDSLKKCFTQSSIFSCTRVRAHVLKRHFQELKISSPSQTQVRWFSLDNPKILPAYWTQGIYFSARNQRFIEDRYILVKANGVQQTFILLRSLSNQGDQADIVFKQILGTLKNFSELDSAKLFLDHEIGLTRLDHIAKIPDPQKRLKQYLRTSMMLMSKITVDPLDINAFFHFSGVLSLIFYDLKKNIPHLVAFYQPYILSNLHNIYRYTRDMKIQDEKLQQIEQIWFKIKNSL